MKSKLLDTRDGLRTFILVFDTDDEFITEIRRFAGDQQLRGSHFTAIGAFRAATLAYWNPDTKEYEHIPVDEQVEVASLVGNIARAPDRDAHKVHAHVVLGRRNGTALAGHIIDAHVRPTLEVVLTEQPENLQRQIDQETGLALIRF